MKLLITTQAVDTEDPVLGFFVRWVEELSKHFERIEVICLKEGKHALPAHVRVYSLGKERGRAHPALYAFRFFVLVWKLRYAYDAVFVHMNEEYVLLAGWFWRMLRKKTVLWRNYRMGSWRTRLAIRLSDTVCHTSPQAFVATAKSAVRMPIGIDTEMFTSAAHPAPADTILFLGRLDPVKKPQIFLQALSLLVQQGVVFRAALYGDPTDPNAPYAAMYAALAAPLAASGVLTTHGAVTHADTPVLYQTHAIYVNLTPSGSFDKTIGEALASGCMVAAVNEAVRTILPETHIAGDSAESAAAAIRSALAMGTEERAARSQSSRAYIEREHSLQLLMERLRAVFL